MPVPQGHLEWALGSVQVALVALRIPIRARLNTVVIALWDPVPECQGTQWGLDRLR